MYPSSWFRSSSEKPSEKPYCGIREYSWLRAVAQSVGNVVKNSGPGAIRRQKELFGLLDEIRYENPFAIEQTARWGRRHGVPELADKLVLAPHPVLPSMCVDPAVGRVPESMISVADWTVKAKDADLLVKTLAHVLWERPEATATVIGRGSGRVVERILDFRFGILDFWRVQGSGGRAENFVASFGEKRLACTSQCTSTGLGTTPVVLSPCRPVARGRGEKITARNAKSAERPGDFRSF